MRRSVNPPCSGCSGVGISSFSNTEENSSLRTCRTKKNTVAHQESIKHMDWPGDLENRFFLPSEPLVWLWSSLAWAPHTLRIPGRLHHSGRLSSTLWLLNNEPKIWSWMLKVSENKAWMQKSKHFRGRLSLTFVQKGFILQRLLASCTARLKFFISMCNSARWHSSLPAEGTVGHKESRRHGVSEQLRRLLF